MSDGEPIEKAIANGEHAKRCWIDAMKEGDGSIPPPSIEPAGRATSGKSQPRAPKSLHRWRAKREGVSVNTLAMPLLAEGVAGCKRP
jgi:antitoxin HicB